jgi:hypothetical protein
MIRIVFDQLDDTEITHKDFLDLLGRLRGNTPIDRITADAEGCKDWPANGPRWFIGTCNPVRNWLYKELVEPYFMYKMLKTQSPRLLADDEGKPIIAVSATTYDNVENTGEDYVQTMKRAYSGSMYKRYVEGSWEGFDGLVYDEFHQLTHIVSHDELVQYVKQLRLSFRLTWFGGYDHGLMSPTCYGLWFADPHNNVFLLDGMYEANSRLASTAKRIHAIHDAYEVDDITIYSDPDCFKQRGNVGQTVADQMASEHGLSFIPGNNAIIPGITKLQGYMHISGEPSSPHYRELWCAASVCV